MRLGFDVRVVQEAVRARNAGLFAMEPPSDLAERIMEACRHLLPATTSEEQGLGMPVERVSTGISWQPDEGP